MRTDGIAYRDFVRISDAIEAVRLLSADAGKADQAAKVFNLSSGKTERLDWLASEIQRESQEMLGREIQMETGHEADRFINPFEVPNDRLRSLGWTPRVSLKEDIRATLRFFIDESAK